MISASVLLLSMHIADKGNIMLTEDLRQNAPNDLNVYKIDMSVVSC